MFRFTPCFYLKCLPKVNNISGKRCFLSAAYKCSDVWRNRLQNNVLKNVNVEDLYFNLDNRFNQKNRVSFIDVDLFLNSLKDSDFKNEIQDVLVRFRLCPECSILPERATHAAIRWYMDHAPKEDLFNVLSDRLNFGLFPDYYLSNLLMNNFILQKDVTSAVKIAVLQMLQEDFGNSLNKALALYSCFAYLDSPDVWPSLESTNQQEEDEEIKKVRVPFLRNPYFDDHFDITNTNHLVGKTIHMLGTALEGSLGTSCQLIGLVLYEKYEKACALLKELLENKREIHSDAIERVSNYLNKPPKQSVIKGDDSSKEGESEGSENSQKSESGSNSKAGSSDKFKEEMLQLLGKVESQSLIKTNLLEETREFVEKAVKENEENDIKFQTQLYKQWEEDRKRDVEVEIERKKKEDLMTEIEEIKKELNLEEERLFYFDKEDEIEIKLEEIEKEKESVVYWKESGKQKAKADSYIPPDVFQRKV